MPSYSELNSSYASYQGLFNTVKKISEVGLLSEDYGEYEDLIGIDPMTSSMLFYGPVFFDSMYEKRKVQSTNAMAWQSGHKLSRAAGLGVKFNSAGLPGQDARASYTTYLDGKPFSGLTVVFVYKTGGTAHEYLGACISKRIFTLRTAAGASFVSVTFPLNGSSVLSTAPATFGWHAVGAPYGTDSLPLVSFSGIDVNDGEPHLIAYQFDAGSGDTTIVTTVIDGISNGSPVTVGGNYIGEILEFGFGTHTYETFPNSTPLDSSNTSVSHLALYDKIISNDTLRAWYANLDIPDEGGYYILADGRWRQVLL